MSLLGTNTPIPTINNLNAGNVIIQSADDATGSTIQNVANGFDSTINPVGPGFNNGLIVPYGEPNPNAFDVLLSSTNFQNQLLPVGPGQNIGVLEQLPDLNIPSIQGIPDLGYDPSADDIISASTQFEAGLETVGPQIDEGYPLSIDADANDVLGQSYNYFNNVSNASSSDDSSYSPYETSASTSSSSTTPSLFTSFEGQSGRTAQEYNAFSANPYQLPDIIPTSDPQETYNFVQQFNALPESEQSQIRQQDANPTTVNTSILNTLQIASSGGQYGSGFVVDPFNTAGFITPPTSSSINTQQGITTTGNNSGIAGTAASDFLIGTSNTSDVIDGMGGQDTIIGGASGSLINIHPGDWVTAQGGTNTMFYNFDASNQTQTRPTLIEGGGGASTLVLQTSNSLLNFTPMSDGSIRITAPNGTEIFTRNISNYITTDTAGNIISTYSPSQTQEQ